MNVFPGVETREEQQGAQEGQSIWLVRREGLGELQLIFPC